MSKTLDKLDSAGANIIDSVEVYGQKLVSFLETEVPELLSEIIVLQRCFTSGYLILGVFLTIAGLICLKKMVKFAVTFEWEDDNALQCLTCIFGICVGLGGVIAGPIVFFTRIGDCITVFVAPRIYLLEYCSNLIK